MASYDIEKSKVDVDYLERVSSGEEAAIDARIDALTPEEQKRVIRKIDRRLVLTLGFMYCVSLMDRTNLGIAAVAGMAYDLALAGPRYSIIVLVFFITYVALQPPATVILRKVGPRIFLPAITLTWGVIMIGFGFVKNWNVMIGLRLLLGVCEAGFFPGCAYLLSCWYPRYDLQKRNAVFYLIGSMSSAFSGILAYGFSKMAGLGHGEGLGQHYGPTKANPKLAKGIMHGIAGWRWIFIMQGVLTCVVAFISIVTIVDFPELSTKTTGWKFLNEKEAAFVVARIEKDRHDAIPEEFKIRKYLNNAMDLKVWGFACLFMFTTTCTYAIAYFLPIILKDGMGFSTAMSQILIAPPYVAAAIVMFLFAVLGDKYHVRSPFIFTNAVLALIGLPLLGFGKHNAVRYFGVFLATISANANIPVVLTWQANNIRGQWKRALCSATLVGFGGIGGIIGGTVFRDQDKPGYRPGLYACMLAQVLMILVAGAMVIKFKLANKRAEGGGKCIEGLAGFRYTL